MRMRQVVFGGILALGVCSTVYLSAQDPADEVRISTMRPIVRGRTQAAASMKAEATRAADRILQAGGNAFDAAVAGQAVLGLVDAANNGVGSDAVILVYDDISRAQVGKAPQHASAASGVRPFRRPAPAEQPMLGNDGKMELRGDEAELEPGLGEGDPAARSGAPQTGA